MVPDASDHYEARLLVKDRRCWVAIVSAKHRIRVKVIARKSLGGLTTREIASVTYPYANIGDVLKAIEFAPGVIDLKQIAVGSRTVLIVVDSIGCEACQALDLSPCLPMEITGRPKAGLEWILVSPSASGIQILLREWEKRDIDVVVRGIRRPKFPAEMTARQYEILSVAIDMGYFEQPRRATLRDIAEAFGISRSSVDQTLRMALAWVLGRAV